MAVHKTVALAVTYYKTNTTTIDLSSDVIGIPKLYTKDNTIGSCVIRLKNKAAYSQEGTNEYDAYIRYDHDITVKIDGNANNDFYGIVTDKKLNTDNTIDITIEDYKIVLKRHPVTCMNRIKVSKPLYSGTPANGILTDTTNAGILMSVHDSGAMLTDPGGSKTFTALTMDISNDAKTTTIINLFKVGRGESCFDAVSRLAQKYDYIFDIIKTIGGSNETILTFSFYPKSVYSGSAWTKGNAITSTYGINIKDSGIEKITPSRADRVVVYGNNDYDITAIAIGSVEENVSEETLEFTDDTAVSEELAQETADTIYNRYRNGSGNLIQKYSGISQIIPLAGEHPKPDDHLNHTDSRFGLALVDATALRISEITISIIDEEYIVDCGVDDSGYDIVTYIQDTRKEIKALRDLRDNATTIDPCLVQMPVEEATIAHNLTGNLAPYAITLSEPSGGKLRATWADADQARYTETGGTQDDFVKYELYIDDFTPPTTLRATSTTEADLFVEHDGAYAAGTWYAFIRTYYDLNPDNESIYIDSEIDSIVMAGP